MNPKLTRKLYKPTPYLLLMKKLYLGLLFFLSLLPLVSADVIAGEALAYSGWSFVIFLMVLIVVVETILFWLLINKPFKLKVGFWRSLLIVAVANIVTFIVGIFISITMFNGLIPIFLIAAILSIILEWGVYLLFFARKKNVKIKLFFISLIVNAVSYALFGLVYYAFVRSISTYY